MEELVVLGHVEQLEDEASAGIETQDRVRMVYNL